jgi:two-component system CitB family response regulator
VHYLVKPFEPAELTQRLEEYARRIGEIASGGEADQESIDRAFGTPGPTVPEAAALPKGLSPQTAELVAQALQEHGARSAGTDLSATECAELTGVSRVSARRYLEYFTEAGKAEVRLRYGSAGRPERRYAWR